MGTTEQTGNPTLHQMSTSLVAPSMIWRIRPSFSQHRRGFHPSSCCSYPRLSMAITSPFWADAIASTPDVSTSTPEAVILMVTARPTTFSLPNYGLMPMTILGSPPCQGRPPGWS